MNVLTPLRRPEYAFRPSQVLRRLRYRTLRRQPEIQVTLPWGLPVIVEPQETIGRAICTVGLDDLPVSEIIWRLMQPGAVAVDVGANLGQMTSIMALRAGPEGHVLAFEPHPILFQRLKRNIENWRISASISAVTAIDRAISNRNGFRELFFPQGFGHNHGLASLECIPGCTDAIPVRSATLDEIIDHSWMIDLIKIDVEGHEDHVVAGMHRILHNQKAKNVIFEEHRPLPSPLCQEMSDRGFECFVISRSFWGPSLVPVGREEARAGGHATSILATRENSQVLESLKARGWFCLEGHPKGPDGLARMQVSS